MEKFINKVKKLASDIKEDFSTDWNAIPSEILAKKTIRIYTIIELIKRIMIIAVIWVIPIIFELLLKSSFMITMFICVSLVLISYCFFINMLIITRKKVFSWENIKAVGVINYLLLLGQFIYTCGIIDVVMNTPLIESSFGKKIIKNFNYNIPFEKTINWIFFIFLGIIILHIIQMIIKSIMQKAIQRDIEYKPVFFEEIMQGRPFNYHILENNNPWRKYEKMIDPGYMENMDMPAVIHATISDIKPKVSRQEIIEEKKAIWDRRLNSITSVNSNVNQHDGFDRLDYIIEKEQDKLGVIKYSEFILQSPWPFKFEIKLKFNFNNFNYPLIHGISKVGKSF